MFRLCTAGLTDPPPKRQTLQERPLKTTMKEVNAFEALVLVWQCGYLTTSDIALAFEYCFVCRYARQNMYKLIGRMYSISQEQVVCLFRVFIGKNVFITGPAGTGKSFIMGMIYTMLSGMGKRAARTASTGVASIAIGGQTIHSFTGIGINQALRPNTMIRWRDEENYVWQNFNKLDALMLDEVSMINAAQFGLIESVPRFLHNYHGKAAAGIQMVVSGDFLQLPPVNGEFAFKSDAWKRLNLVPCCLTTSYRQLDSDWFEILCKLRKGLCDPHSKLQLLNRLQPKPDPDCCRLYSMRRFVQKVNLEKLADLPSNVSRRYDSITEAYKLTKTGRLGVRKYRYGTEIATSLDKYFKVEHSLELKVGCKVMLVENNVADGVANGSVGTVLSIKQAGCATVQFDDIEKPVIVKPVEWRSMNPGGKLCYTRKQIPLILAYAITIHKAQGMGLKRARTSLKCNEIFQAGQAYVSLSRIQTLDGLDLDGFDVASIRANIECLKFYEGLEEV